MPRFSWRDLLSSPRNITFVLQQIIFIVLIIVAALTSLLSPSQPSYFLPCAVVAYRVIVEPISPALETFIIKEDVVLTSKITDDPRFSPNSIWSVVNTDDGRAFRLSTRQVDGIGKGLVLKEVTVEPSKDWYSLSNLPDSNRFDLSLSCAKTSLELRDFPKNSFYAAKEATNLEVSPYIDTETITWVAHNLDERKIEFAYVPPPYYLLKWTPSSRHKNDWA